MQTVNKVSIAVAIITLLCALVGALNIFVTLRTNKYIIIIPASEYNSGLSLPESLKDLPL